MSVVAVEPLDLGVGQAGQFQAGSVDGHDGEGVEAVELAVFGLAIGNYHSGVLDTDTVGAFGVDTGLDGQHHALLQDDVLIAEALGTFVDVEQVANAVAGTTAVIQAVLPQDAAGKDIQLAAGHTLLEADAGQGDDGFQHQGVVPALFLGDLAQGEGTGGVGGAFQVLAAAVVEQEVAGVQGLGVLGGRSVVHHSCVFTVGHDGGEAVFAVMLLLGTALAQFLGSGPLGESGTFFQLLKQPAVELGLGDAVFQVSFVGIGGLGLVFAGLEQLDRFGAGNSGQGRVFLYGAVEAVVELLFVAEDGQFLVQLCNIGEYLVIRTDGNAVFRQSGADFGGDAAVIRKEDGLGGSRQRKASGC